MRTKKYSLFQSLSFSFKGIIKAVGKERNLKIHLALASVAVFLGIMLKISKFEWLVLVLIIGLVIGLEIFNSALEAICDLLRFKLKLSYYETYWIRNFSAGAVMILALSALILGIIIFLPKLLGY